MGTFWIFFLSVLLKAKEFDVFIVYFYFFTKRKKRVAFCNRNPFFPAFFCPFSLSEEGAFICFISMNAPLAGGRGSLVPFSFLVPKSRGGDTCRCLIRGRGGRGEEEKEKKNNNNHFNSPTSYGSEVESPIIITVFEERTRLGACLNSI